MNVLLLAGRHSPEARRVARALRKRGVTVQHCRSDAFPERTRLSQRDGAVFMGGKPLCIPVSVYVRGLACHPLTPGFEDALAARARGLIAQCDEKRALLESILLTLQDRGARLVNPPEANAQHSRKPWQLERLRKAALPLPAFLATNDPVAVRQFVRRHGATVYKPLAGGATVRRVEAADLSPARLAQLALAPVLFQAYVPGVSVRAYVVGRQVVAAAEIHSTELDYRRGEGVVSATRLSGQERRAVLKAARVCGMGFAGVDLIRGEDGFWLLECNPSPMFAAFEDKTGLEVGGPLAAFLVGGSLA